MGLKKNVDVKGHHGALGLHLLMLHAGKSQMETKKFLDFVITIE